MKIESEPPDERRLGQSLVGQSLFSEIEGDF
jgi:hypothetical protein